MFVSIDPKRKVMKLGTFFDVKIYIEEKNVCIKKNKNHETFLNIYKKKRKLLVFSTRYAYMAKVYYAKYKQFMWSLYVQSISLTEMYCTLHMFFVN